MEAIRHAEITGPYTHGNLSLFLVHGAEQEAGAAFLTLQEALEAGVLVVHETGHVNELEVENLSGEQEVYIEAGEIVRGGKQDRVLTADVVIPARSGKVPVPAFCVEQGRWARRGREAQDTFSESTTTLSSKSLKSSTRITRDQRDVWASVVGFQAKLSRKLGVDVKDGSSGSSLRLTLDNENLNKETSHYTEALEGAPSGRDDVIGFALAVNGELSSANVYASIELFRKLWPKLLNAGAVEAVAEKGEKDDFVPPAVEEVRSFLEEPEKGEPMEEEVTKRVHVIRRETDTAVLFETRDRKTPGIWLHRAYLAK